MLDWGRAASPQGRLRLRLLGQRMRQDTRQHHDLPFARAERQIISALVVMVAVAVLCWLSSWRRSAAADTAHVPGAGERGSGLKAGGVARATGFEAAAVGRDRVGDDAARREADVDDEQRAERRAKSDEIRRARPGELR